MNKNSCSKAALWEEYEALQRKADRPKLDSYMWAIEDQLNHFLESVRARSLSPEPKIRSVQLHTLLCNRTKKHARRTRLLELYRTSFPAVAKGAGPIEKLIFEETLARVRGKASEQEWRILSTFAHGKSYADVARAENMSTSALKSKVSRLRGRLKQS